MLVVNSDERKRRPAEEDLLLRLPYNQVDDSRVATLLPYCTYIHPAKTWSRSIHKQSKVQGEQGVTQRDSWRVHTILSIQFIDIGILYVLPPLAACANRFAREKVYKLPVSAVIAFHK